MLVVHPDPHEGHLPAIGGDLRVADPHEVEEVFFGDGARLGLLLRCHARQQRQNEE
jgi:hypothetical protein